MPEGFKQFLGIGIAPAALGTHAAAGNAQIAVTEDIVHYHTQRIYVAACIDILLLHQQFGPTTMPITLHVRLVAPPHTPRKAEVNEAHIVAGTRNKYVFGGYVVVYTTAEIIKD